MDGSGGLSRERVGLGVAAVLAAALCTSLSGILVRLTEHADGWQILFWRSFFCIVTLLVYLGWRHGARIGDSFLSIGRTGLLCSLTLGSSFITFIFALTNTTVANVAFTIGMAPVFAALLGWGIVNAPWYCLSFGIVHRLSFRLLTRLFRSRFFTWCPRWRKRQFAGPPPHSSPARQHPG